MELSVAYQGRSKLVRGTAGMALTLAPNLRRDRVGFVGELLQPLRFREAISALHDVVISDLRYRPRDPSNYQAYQAEQNKRLSELRRSAFRAAKQEILAREPVPMPEGLPSSYQRMRSLYWGSRQKYADYLARNDPKMWRLLLPCDPVITVADDVVFFECFSADESSYGCLTVGREAFATQQDVSLGTTNVDYSWRLYEQFQELRSYRSTRFAIDPSGFEVKTETAEYREEKIDLPNSWLRGFMQLQSAMSLPLRRVPISREGIYNVLAWLKRHKAAKSPRAIRFELEPGKPVALVLEPWDKRIVLHSTPYQGTRAETIRVWGRDRLRVLARLLPILEEGEVYLLGTGLPSFWSMKLGEMRLLLGLSGWTTNEWTGSSSLDQLALPVEFIDHFGVIGSTFRNHPAQSFEQVRQRSGAAAPFVAASLNRLALLGQVIHDLAGGVYRWRQILPMEMSLESIGVDSPETTAARQFVEQKRVQVSDNVRLANGLQSIHGKVSDTKVEAILDADGRIMRGKCSCSHHHRFGLRSGPCRHLQALRTMSRATARPATLQRWFEQLWN